jgi:hypothetical protein
MCHDPGTRSREISWSDGHWGVPAGATPMPASRLRRRFNRLDAVPPIAVTAFGLAMSKARPVLRPGGGRRPEASRIDRAGRLCGALWIAIGIASWVDGLLR